MKNHYETLGVNSNATQDEIKKAFRALAKQHHPDAGGNQQKFQIISAAYEVLSDPKKRAEYDQSLNRSNIHINTTNFEDIFGPNSPFSEIFGYTKRIKNKDLSIKCNISLLDAYQGKQLEARYTLPSGKPETVMIDIPPGITHGTTIRYHNYGDDTIPNIPRGNLNVTVFVNEDPTYKRINDDLYSVVEINSIEAIIGCTKEIQTITNQKLTLKIKPGTQNGDEYENKNEGFVNVQTKKRGKFIVIVKIVTPIITNKDLLENLKTINETIKNTVD